MRWVITLWFLPMALFWGWYLASAADLGGIMFSRRFHEQMFDIYGNALGVDPVVIPGWLLKGCIVDSIVVLGLLAFAKRRAIADRWREWRQPSSDASLSSTP